MPTKPPNAAATAQGAGMRFMAEKVRRSIRMTPNVRAKLAPTVWRQGQVGENVQRTADLALVTRRWGSA